MDKMNEMTVMTVMIDGESVEYIRKDSSTPDMPEGLEYAIVRSREQGVMCGYIESIGGPEGRSVTLRGARQMWSWDSKFVLPDVAEYGPASEEGCRFSVAMSRPALVLAACGIMYCTEEAGAALRAITAQDKK